MKNKLTPEKREERDLWIDKLSESKELATQISKSKVFERDVKGLEIFQQFQSKIEQGLVKIKEHGKERTATVDDFLNIIRLDRDWTPEILEECALGLRCPLDLTYYADQFGGEEDGSK